MYNKINILQPQEHSFYRFTPAQDFYYAKKMNLIPITFNEVKFLCCDYPIVIIIQNEKPTLMLMTGIEKNNALDEQGKWKGTYIPSFLKRYPFTLVQTEEKDTLKIGFDIESGLFSSPEGHPLFTNEGKATEVLENIKKFLTAFQKENQITDTILQLMQEKELLQPALFKIKKEGEEARQIGGFFKIDQKKLLEQKDDFLLETVKNGWMELIELQNFSLSAIKKLSV